MQKARPGPVRRQPIPAPAEGKRGETGHLAYLLRQASAAVRLTLDRALAEYGVTLPQFSVLTMVAAYPPLSGADLARLSLLTPQTVNVIVRNLVRRGAVRTEPDPVHGRILRLTVTPDGRRLLGRCKAAAARVETQLVAGLPSSAEKTLRRWLTHVARDLPG